MTYTIQCGNDLELLQNEMLNIIEDFREHAISYDEYVEYRNIIQDKIDKLKMQ